MSLPIRPEVSPARYAVVAGVLIGLVNNVKFVEVTLATFEPLTLSGFGFLVGGCLAIVTVFAFFFLLFAHGRALRPVVVGAAIASSILGYFTQNLGVVFDQAMMHNIADNLVEANTAEAGELLSGPLLLHVLAYGVLPCVLLSVFRIRCEPWRADLGGRGKYALALVALLVLTFAVQFRSVPLIARENRALRVWVTPTYAAHSLNRFVRETYLESEAIEVVGQDTVIDRDRPGRVVGVVLVGESARADHFSLNGYERRTNPKLEQRPLIVFPHASSPGTSTANSVPAMFTFVEAARYTPRKAQHQTSVLDLLEQVGVEVHWIDNNSSSKGAYEGTGYERLTADEPYLEFVDGSGALHDDVFFEDLARLIAEAPGDVVVVLHCMGSHGPAYHRRYPEAFEVFQPSCTLDAPQQCNNTELVNAYDNTILYTDHIADRVIDVLETLDPDDRSFMLYASDHGESLGENGVYLHGFPVFMAPDAQTHVGMFAWMSDRAAAPDRQEEGEPTFSLDERVVTHFDLAHTLMDLFGARSTIVDPTRVLLHWQSSRGAPPGELVDGFDVDSN